MKPKDWNEGLNQIDADLVEEFVAKSETLKKKTKKRVLLPRVGALAACVGILATCLCLIVGAILAPMLQKPDSVSITQRYEPSPEPKHYGTEGDFSRTGFTIDAVPPYVSVVARLKEVLPDTYTFYNDWKQTEFRLLKMETVEVFVGKEMTEEFLYIVPVEYMTDFTVYSKFVIRGMGQRSFDYCVLYNQTKDCPQSLDLTLWGTRYCWSLECFHFNLNAGFMALDENDVLDRSLWQSTPAWVKVTKYEFEEYEGYTLSQVKQLPRADGYKLNLLTDLGEEAKQALESVKSFEDHLYVPHYSDSRFTAIRYINGFATNQRITIYDNVVLVSKAQFEENDLLALPDLTSARHAMISAFEEGALAPPHIKNYNELSQSGYGIFCWYAKTENEVIGVICVNWKLFNGVYYLYDDAYYIVEYGSDVCEPVDRDALLNRIGEHDETDFIYKGEYDGKGKK